MTDVYSTRLCNTALISANPATLYTVPAGKLVVVRNIWINLTGGDSGSAVSLRIGSNAFLRIVMADNTSVHYDTRVVMAAGEQLTISANINKYRCTVSGFIFDA